MYPAQYSAQKDRQGIPTVAVNADTTLICILWKDISNICTYCVPLSTSKCDTSLHWNHDCVRQGNHQIIAKLCLG